MSDPAIVAQAAFTRQTILLAEDNEDDVFIMRRAFQKAGIVNPIQPLTDGEKVINYLSGDAEFADRQRFPMPVMILLDLNMPRKSGLEVLAWIRQQPGFGSIAVYILSASTREGDVQRAFELGVNAYIVKPSKIEALTEMVQAWHAFVRFQAFPMLQTAA